MRDSLLWLYGYLKYMYNLRGVSFHIACEKDGDVYIPANVSRLMRTTKRNVTTACIRKQLRELEKFGLIKILVKRRKTYYTILRNESPQIFSEKFPKSFQKVSISTQTNENENKNELKSPPSEGAGEGMNSKGLVSTFEFFRDTLREYGYAPPKRPTGEEVKYLKGMIRAFDRLEMPLKEYLMKAINNWPEVRRELGDWKIGYTPTLKDLCSRRLDILKTLSKDRTTENCKSPFTEEELEQVEKQMREEGYL